MPNSEQIEQELQKLAKDWQKYLADAFQACHELEQIQQQYQEMYEFLNIDEMNDEDSESADDLFNYRFEDTTAAIVDMQSCAIPLNNEMTKWLLPDGSVSITKKEESEE